MKTGLTTSIFSQKGFCRNLIRGLSIAGVVCFSIFLSSSFARGGDVPNFIDAIIPAPKAVEYGRWVVFRDSPQVPTRITVYLPQVPHVLELAGVEAIRDRLAKLGKSSVAVEVVRGLDIEESDGEEQFSIYIGTSGRNEPLRLFYESIGLTEINEAEGYRLRTTFDENGIPQLMVVGSDVRGVFYGIQSFIQMMTLKGDDLAFREMQIDDWPSFSSRASGNDEKPPSSELAEEAISFFARFKINGWPLGQSYHWPQNWRDTPDSVFQTIRQASSSPDADAVDIRFQIHPFGRSQDARNRYAIRVSSSSDRNIFVDSIRRAIRSGSSEVLIRADDFHELSSSDERAFGSKAAAHAHLINHTYRQIIEEYPDVTFYFCPPYYTAKESINAGEARSYMQEIGRSIPSDIVMLWTGPDVISNSFARNEHLEFSRLIDRPAYLWDNTIFQESSAFGYRYEFATFFLEPFETRYPEDLAEVSPGIRFNFGYDGTWINQIGNIVLADYLWNPEAFDSEQSLRRAVGICVGPQSVDAYLETIRQLKLIWDLKHSPARWAMQPVPSSESFRDALRRLEANSMNSPAIRELEARWSALSTSAEQLNQLVAHFQSQRSRMASLLYPNSGDWKTGNRGAWSTQIEDGVVQFSFPYRTEGVGGNFASRSTVVDIPESSNGRFFLHFVFDDSYRGEGGPPMSYPGYFFKQVLIDGEVVWEEDAEGIEPILPTTIEISRHLRGKHRAELTVRCVDKKGVSNLGVQASVSPLLLTFQ